MLLVVSDESGGLVGDLLEDIVDEGVHDGHGSLGDTSLGVNLLEDSVDVDGEGLGSLGSSLWGNSLLALLSWGVSSGFSCHFVNLFVIKIRLITPYKDLNGFSQSYPLNHCI